MKKAFKIAAGSLAALVLGAFCAATGESVWAAHKLEKYSTPGRPLTAGEIRMSRPFFGDSIDYSRVRLHDAPEAGDDAATMGNDIYLEDPRLHGGDFARPGIALNDTRVLEHELTHVWRYQNERRVHAFLAFVGELPQDAANTLTGSHFRFGFDADPDSKTEFADWGWEQQAYFVDKYARARAIFIAGECGTPDQGTGPACRELRDGVHQYEEKLKTALPLPGALTLGAQPGAGNGIAAAGVPRHHIVRLR